MNVFRVLIAGSVGVLALAAPALAQIQIQVQPIQRKAVQGKAIQLQPRGQADVPLLAEEAVAKLKLTAAQKENYAKIEAEYKDKQKASQAALQAAIQLRDREKFKEAQEKFQTDTKKSREDHLAKVEKILTGEQKAVFAQVKEQPPQPRRPGVGAVQIGGQGVQVLPLILQRRLNLTDEQKKQIDAIQKEVEAKILKVLDEEQRKQYEQLKKGPAVRPVRPVQPNQRIQPARPRVLPAPPAKD